MRAYKALYAGNCLPSGPDDTAKLLFLMATVITPILTFSIIAMTFARMEAELRRANEELQAMSETDALTSLANRRKFDAAYKGEWDRAMRLQQPMAVVILDVDDFKHYNDRYGHQVGDACLQALAQVLKEHTRRAMDVAARYGGEEFAMILPGMDGAAAAALAEDVRRSFEQKGIEHAGLEPAGPEPAGPDQAKGRRRTVVTISAGVASLVPSVKERRFDLLSAADTALYAAKALGKNAVVLA
ncbi:GGDEF domain-containing protein [Desulfovibrio desulfuricans]|uniref:GGDEF domain-containing protein n=1 Tax=Desulfovibrio desulfuricans TaxID=876 RepID=UPI0035AFC2A4